MRESCARLQRLRAGGLLRARRLLSWITSRSRCGRRASSIFIYRVTVRPVCYITPDFSRPEFQIINAGSAYFRAQLFLQRAFANNDLHRWGIGRCCANGATNHDAGAGHDCSGGAHQPRHARGSGVDSDPSCADWIRPNRRNAFAAPIPKYSRSDRAHRPGGWQWHKERLKLAIYLISHVAGVRGAAMT